ncbi:MAG: META domain-containing protein [Sphingopyxis sp.]
MNRRTLLIALPAFALAGCAAITTPPGDVPTGEAWFALGNEPFWNVEITTARIVYHDADGRRISVANPGAQLSFNGERYVTPQITVDVTHGTCRDGMSERRYGDTVIVEAGGRTLRGCGGRVLPPTHLDGTNWRILSIDGAAMAAGRGPAELRFAGNRISGGVGCNRLSGNFTSDGVRLTVTQIVSTRMACESALAAQEARLIALLGQSLAMRIDGHGRLILIGGTNASPDAQIVLERVI